MPLLRNGQLIEHSPWIRLDDEQTIPVDNEGRLSGPPVLVSLDRFLALEDRAFNPVSGLVVQPDDDVLRLDGHLDQLQLIVVDFPVFTDGRGYSHARTLRSELGFAGELRATGDVRPDQMLFMMRSGIDTFEFDEAPDLALVKSILTRYSGSYQPSYRLPMAGLRRARADAVGSRPAGSVRH